MLLEVMVPPLHLQISYSKSLLSEINPESVIRRDSSDLQVDMHRKLMEDPLLLIRKKEEETKRQITNNPVKMKQLQQLVRSWMSVLRGKITRSTPYYHHHWDAIALCILDEQLRLKEEELPFVVEYVFHQCSSEVHWQD